MTSIINAVRNITNDNLWLLKVIGCSLLVYIPASLWFKKSSDIVVFTGVTILCLVVLIGISSEIIHNVVKNKNQTLPGIKDIPAVIINSIVCPVLMIPGIALYYFLWQFILPFLNFEEAYIFYFIQVLYTVILSPFIFLPSLFFVIRKKIKDIFNLPRMYKSAGNFTLEMISFLIQYIFTVVAVFAIIYLILITVFNVSNEVMYAFYSFFTALSLLVFYSFISELYPVTIPDFNSK